MKILYLAHRIPYPPDKGDKIRSYHQVRHLAESHELHLACLVDDPQDMQHVAALEKICASVDVAFRSGNRARLQALLALPGSTPLSVAAFHSAELRNKVEKRLRTVQFDLLYAFSSAMAQYAPWDSDVPKVMDFGDMDSEKWRELAEHKGFPMSWVYSTEARRLARFEGEVARAFDFSVFVSSAEAELFRQQLGIQAVDAIPNGVDLEYFTPAEDGGSSDGRPTLVFTGVMDYFPNIDGVQHFCDTTLGLIQKELPDVRFIIVGRNPTRQVLELARHPNVEVTGSVPDVRPYLRQADVAVTPLRIARGIQNKILEAMAMGLPVVCTSVAHEGIGATPSDGVRVADEPAVMAREIVGLLQDATLRRECRERARRYVCTHHRWDDQGKHLDALLARAAGPHTAVQDSVNAPTA